MLGAIFFKCFVFPYISTKIRKATKLTYNLSANQGARLNEEHI